MSYVLPTIHKSVVAKDAVPGSIGKKWGIDGITVYPEHLRAISVEVTRTPTTKDVVAELATLHEVGHAEACVDIVRNVGNGDAFNTLCTQDKWRGEVEAWMRGLEHHTIDLDDAMLILDCLNSYRRGIPATDDQWRDAIDLLGTVYDGDVQDLHDYVPLEPDPGEKPRDCQPSTVEDDGRGDDPKPEDGDGDEDKGGGDNDDDRDDPEKGENDGYTKKNQYDNGWLKQEILDKVAAGDDVQLLAIEYDLDVDKMPPVIKAMR